MTVRDKDAHVPPSRFRFFLTAITVIVALGLFLFWLEYEWELARMRLDLARRIERAGGEVHIAPTATHPHLSIREMGRVALCGDLPALWIQMPSQKFSPQDEAVVRSLYPHSQVDRYLMYPTAKGRWRNFDK